MAKYIAAISNAKHNQNHLYLHTMKQEKKENRGGKRLGAGQPFKYGEKTINITFRIPTSHKELIKAMVKEYLDRVSTEHKLNKPTKSEHYGC